MTEITLPSVLPYEPCSRWTQRPFQPLFKSNFMLAYDLADFYWFFRHIMDINLHEFSERVLENEETRKKLNESTNDRIELWQKGNRVDVVYYYQEFRILRADTQKKELYVPGGRIRKHMECDSTSSSFPLTTHDKLFPIIEDDQRMQFDLLCLFIQQQIQLERYKAAHK